MKEIICHLLRAMAAHPTVTRHVLAIKKRVYTPLCDLAVEAVSTAEPIPMDQLARYRPIPMEPGQRWTDVRYGACWLHLTGTVPPAGDNKRLVGLLSLGGEGLGYVDGQPVDIVTPLMSVPDALQPPTVGKRVIRYSPLGHAGDPVDMWVDAGNNGITGQFVLQPKLRYARLAGCDDALLDFYYDYLTLALLLATDEDKHLSKEDREALDAALSMGYRLYAKGDLAGAKAALAEYYALQPDEHDVLYTLVGHAHLDLAWLWPERESRRKALRTFTNALSLMEACPDYVFGASQAQMFDWIRVSDPAVFAALQRRANEGKLEVQGGMWVECDCNIPTGESLVRQFLYGDRFFRTYFGRTSDVVWLPDAFGFPCTLPQIAVGAGKQYFVTTKLYWNQTNTFPYQSFRWCAPDGSALLAHFTPERTYCSDGTPLALAKAQRHNTQPQTGQALVIYGVGDGGGGPGEGHVQVAARATHLRGLPPSRLGSASSFFARLARAEVPEYRGELYLEYHQGTYTSQARCKQYNRQCENQLHILEWLSAVYRHCPVALDDMWQRLLFHQFHDILPGSGIGRVHREAEQQLDALLAQIQREIVDVVDAPKGYALFNPSPFAQNALTVHHGKLYLASAQPYSTAVFSQGNSTAAIGDDEMENNRVRLRFRRGEIVSYMDKATGKEYCAKGLNRLVAYHDKPAKYDAWNLDAAYLQDPIKVRYTGSKSYCEPTHAVTELYFAVGNSRIVQKVSLGMGTQVTFSTHVEWHQSHTILRADFYPAVYAPTAQCDIQFGSIQRATTNRDAVEAAQYEVCAHKYVSLTDGENIFAVYSRYKYGWRVKDGVVSLALLRSPTYPDPDCDRGNHDFEYAMDLPVDEMACVAAAYNFNYPMFQMDKAAVVAPLCTVGALNVVVETIKPCEDGNGIAVRVYERLGQKTACSFVVEGYDHYFETDLEENHATPLEGMLFLEPHQIKTIVCK